MTTVLITGAGGEIGHSLLETFHSMGGYRVIALDLHPLKDHLKALCDREVIGDVSDPSVIASLESEDISEIYHLAALLSTSAEKNPLLAHNVNVNGTVGLLMMARTIGARRGSATKFLFPSTIAVYGFSSLDQKMSAGKVLEHEHLEPITMYGINKLYCEKLGAYVSDNFGQLLADRGNDVVDFRAVRFPGLISATTVPTGGTSDYAPEMIHAAAQGKPYTCFVRPDTQIPFMAMPDGVNALIQLAAAPLKNLSQRMYNIGAFAPSAQQIEERVRESFSGAVVNYDPNPQRQAIVDSWCADVNDLAARNDWGWAPEYDATKAFNDYLIPIIGSVYAG